MQSVSSRIWTRIAVFISFDDNNYTTGTSLSVIFYQVPDNFHLVFGALYQKFGAFYLLTRTWYPLPFTWFPVLF